MQGLCGPDTEKSECAIFFEITNIFLEKSHFEAKKSDFQSQIPAFFGCHISDYINHDGAQVSRSGHIFTACCKKSEKVPI